MDFTLSKYMSIVQAGLDAGYTMAPVKDLLDGKLVDPFIVLRHDVDRRPKNALDMARAEAALGVRSSYYFRSVKASFVPEIIAEIADLGHETGYHYEDWYAARYDVGAAKDLFEKNLKRLQAIAPVETICMHGSPLSRDNNMTIWDHLDFTDYGLKDCILSHDYTGHAFFTDSGRTFGVSGANLRDELGNADIYPEVHSTPDLCAFITARRTNKIMVSVHPERWSDKTGAWTTQMGKDKAINTIKHGLRLKRKLTGKR